MPYIAVRMVRGANLNQKRLLVKDITEVVARDIGCLEQAVTIELEEFAPENIAESSGMPSTGRYSLSGPIKLKVITRL